MVRNCAPENPDPQDNLEIPDQSAARPVRNDGAVFYRTSSFIAPSRPSIVIGYMRCEKMRRMRVVDSE